MLMKEATDAPLGVESRREEAAQQSSAAACVTIVAELTTGRCWSGHAPPWQHWRRASGVACHPAHCASVPCRKPSTQMRAAARLMKEPTLLACVAPVRLSNGVGVY